MITIGAFLAFSGFFSGYNSSQKAVLAGNSALEKWLRTHRTSARVIGLLLLLASLATIVSNNGFAAGTFVFLVLLMVLGSLIVLLSPLKIVTLRTAGIAFAAIFVIELLNFA